MIDVMVNIDVADIAPAARFYTSAFGLRPGRRLGAAAIELVGANAPIFLLAKPPGSAASPASSDRRAYRRHWTPVHLDFVVDDIDGALARAEAAGAVVATREWGKMVMIADPFGNGICIIQLSDRGYDAIAAPQNGLDY